MLWGKGESSQVSVRAVHGILDTCVPLHLAGGTLLSIHCVLPPPPLAGGTLLSNHCAPLHPAGGTLLSVIAPFVHVQFLGSSLTFMMVYVRGRVGRKGCLRCLGPTHTPHTCHSCGCSARRRALGLAEFMWYHWYCIQDSLIPPLTHTHTHIWSHSPPSPLTHHQVTSTTSSRMCTRA